LATLVLLSNFSFFKICFLISQNFDSEQGGIDHLIKRNQALEGKVMRVRERAKHLELIELINKKIPWIEYDNARKDFFAAKDRVVECEENVKKTELDNQPLRDQIS